MYLSPVHKQLPLSETTPTRPQGEYVVQKRPETPNDWKIIKPRRGKRKISEVKGAVDGNSDINLIKKSRNESEKETTINANGKKCVNNKKKKRKGVKLKITKSGEHYQVTETNASVGSSDNSNADIKLQLSQNESMFSNCNYSFVSSSSSTSATPAAKKNNTQPKSYITPHRFTRHMSKNISVSPEHFQKLITLSPEKETDSLKIIQCPSKEIISINKMLTDSFTAHTSSENCPHLEEEEHHSKQSVNRDVEEWSVKSNTGSPTLKTFIRKQKRKHSIIMSPRVELSPMNKGNSGSTNEKKCLVKDSITSVMPTNSSPVHSSIKRKTQLSNPSLLSLVHLSVSPILNNKLPEDTNMSDIVIKSNIKLKSSRRLYRSWDSSSD